VTLAPVNGTATVTATAAASDAWNSATATYTITVYRLPQAYTEQEYITGDGLHYIATGVTFNQSSRIVIDYAFTTSPNGGYLYGAMTVNGTTDVTGADQFVFNLATSGYYKYGTSRVTASGVKNTDRHTIDHDGNVVKFDGAVAHTFTEETFNCPDEMFLLWANWPDGDARVARAKIYSCQMYANGTTLSRNFVPCKRNSNNVEGLYDMVYGSFYPLLDAE
jgi:hypothetical protein